jgi:hypothetical protein
MDGKLKKIRKVVRDMIGLLNNLSVEELENRLLFGKNANDFMVYQRYEHTVPRHPWNDRIFPYETVAIQSFRTDHGGDIEKVNIHIGPYANELAYSMNALAVAIANDIYFKSSAYRPESEEGRKILTHEMTHIVQYRENRTGKNSDRAELEYEAEQSELKAEYDPDPYEPDPVGDRTYHLRRGDIDKVTKMAADEMERWLIEQKYINDENEYFDLLCAYDQWLDEEGN